MAGTLDFGRRQGRRRFSGIQFDGEGVGPKHVFVPFSPSSKQAGARVDGIELRFPG